MIKLKITGVILTLLLITSVIYAQAPFNQEIPEGMEAVQIGGSGWLIIPKGAKTKKVGAQIIVEGVKEYMSRRFEENDLRMEKIEKTLADLTQEIETFKKRLEASEQSQSK